MSRRVFEALLRGYPEIYASRQADGLYLNATELTQSPDAEPEELREVLTLKATGALTGKDGWYKVDAAWEDQVAAIARQNGKLPSEGRDY